MDRNNVVSIHSAKTVDALSPGCKQIVERSHELFSRRAITAVSSMLERVDDALFELADKSTNTTQQNLYFDAMREVRLKRDSIKSEFAQQLDLLFSESLEGRMDSAGTDTDVGNADKLSLIGDDDLEESLAVSNAAGKISSDCRASLFALDRRMGHLLSDPELELHDNPLGPQNVCDAFRTACQSLESGIEVRLLIFKLFEKYVACALNEAYQAANDYLIEQGILPEIRSTIRKSADSQQTRSHGVDSSTANDDQDDGLFMALQKLLNLQMQTVMPNTGLHMGTGHAGAGGAAGIVSDLTRLQQNATEMMQPVAIQQDMPVVYRNIVQELRDNGTLATASPADMQTIDVVSMMFDYILADDAIPVVIKAQIARLQIPVLKAALLDQSLFSKKSHPVRMFLDTIAYAGIGWEGWEPEALDELTGHIESAVQRILLEFEDDIELFRSVHGDLDNYLRKLEEAYAGRHERIAKVLKGRDQIGTAKRRIKDQFADKIINNPVPGFVTEFLLRNWSEVLLKTYVHIGEDSPEWHRELETVDNLIWSLAPKQTREERRKLIELLPRLLIELKAGMKKSGMDEQQRKQFLEQLSECHANVVKPTTQSAKIRPDASVQKQERAPGAGTMMSDVDAPSSSATEPVDISHSPFLRPELLPEDVDNNVHSEADNNRGEQAVSGIQSESELEDCIEAYFRESEEVMRMLSTNELEIEEIELYDEGQDEIDTGPGSVDNDTGLNAQQGEYLRQVHSLKPGDWVEVEGPDGRKLKVKVYGLDTADPDKLNLVDRSGKTVLRKSAASLAMDLETGRAQILDHAPLFERAVKNVVDRLTRLTT